MEILQKEPGRKQCTILYANITGIDKLSEELQPDNISQLMNSCYEMVTSAISLYGGSVDKFSGDGIMAVFGFPDFIERTPLNALNAAFELKQRIFDLNIDSKLPFPISIKIGIQTGMVLFGTIGKKDKMQDTVLGETVTMASRLCDIAENGQILAGKETYEKTKSKFEFHVLEPVPLKGIKRPLPLFEVKGRIKKQISMGKQSGRMINSAMVGRDNDYKHLEKQVMQLINGRGSVVNIIGKAGIGKSRLMAELRQNIVLGKVAVFEGRALSNGQNLSFHPITQIIKSWAGISEEDSPEESKRKLENNIRRIYSEEFDEIFPFIATMMGYRLEGKAKERLKDIEGEALENLILKNMRDLLSKAASIRPVIIVIEDAHWCDISSVIFMESLFKLVQKQMILFVNVFRPGYKETGERIQKFLHENLEAHHLEIKIESLTKKQSDELIDNLLQKVELPDEINSLIIERSAGNPFFIEEVIRSFIDEGLIIIENNSFILTDNIKYANIPESIDNVILSRIDRLDGKTKELLKTASVIGRNFYYKVLEQATETIEEMDNKLEYLKDAQLLNERKHKDEVEFLFKHALAQQATYDSIVERSRKDLHLKIAKSIEKVFAGRIHEFYGTLAHHYEKAGQQERMEEYLVKAGTESMKSGASSEAVNFFKKAMEVLLQNMTNAPNHRKIIDLKEQLAFALYSSGQYVEAIEYFDDIIAFFDKPPPKSKILRIIDLIYHLILGLKMIYFYHGPQRVKPDEISLKLLVIIERKAKALVSVDPKKMFFEQFYGFRLVNKKSFGNYEASCLIGTSVAFPFTGILPKYGKILEEFAIQNIEESYILGWVWSKYAYCVHCHYAGQKMENLEEDKFYKLGMQIGEHWPVTTFYVYGGFNIIDSGDEMLSLHFLKRLKDISEALDTNYSIVQYHRLNAFYNLKFRKIEDSLKACEITIDLAKKTDHALTLLIMYCYQSMAYSFASDFGKAKMSHAEASKHIKDFKIPLCLAQYLISTSYIEINNFKEQIEANRNSIAMLKSTKDLLKQAKKIRSNLTEAHRLRAIVFQLINKPNSALIHFDKSIKAAALYNGNLELSRTYFEAGKFLRDPKNKKERINGMNATECLMKAKSMFEEMNLQWDLEEYEKYMTGKF